MTANCTSDSIHPPSEILTTEVQLEYNILNDIEHLTEFDNEGGIDTRCSNTVTTISSRESSGSGNGERYKLSSGPSTSCTTESQDDLSSQEETKALSWARQAIQDAIDKHTTSPKEEAFSLFLSRQHIRQNDQQQQQQKRTRLPLSTSHPSDESAQYVKHRCTTVNVPSPSHAKKQLLTKSSIILSHHIDRNDFLKQGHDANDDLLFKTIESQAKTTSDIAVAVLEDHNNQTTSKATPNTSRSSSPSESIYDVNVEVENHQNNAIAEESPIQITTSANKVEDCLITPNNIASIEDSINHIDVKYQNNTIDTDNVVTEKQTVLPVNPWPHQHQQDDVNGTKMTSETNFTHESSFDRTKPLTSAVSPIIVQKVAAYIDLVTSTSKSQPAKVLVVNKTDAINRSDRSQGTRDKAEKLDDNTLATSQSYDVNIDPNMMNYVTSSVRDYIDNMHTHKTKTRTFDSRIDNNSDFKNKFKEKRIETLDTVTKSHNLRTDGLVEYLSTKATTKNEKNSFGIDPPSTSEDEMLKIDPPLTLTQSEVTRSATIEPEINRSKTVKSSDEYRKFAATDPDVAKRAIMYDELGERCKKSETVIKLDNSAEDPNLFCDSNTASSSFHPHSEKVVDKPKRKTTVVTIPNLTFVNHKDEILTKDTFEPDGLYPSSAARDFISSTYRLHYLLTGNDDVTEIDIRQFGKLVQYSSLFLDSRLNISSFGTSQIMTRANELNVSLHIADRYLDAIRSMSVESIKAFHDLENRCNITQFLLELNAYLEKLTSNNPQADVKEANHLLSLPIDTRISIDEFEVEVNDGYSNDDFRPSDGEEPWWEVVARLNGTACPDSCQRRDAVNMDNEESKIVSNIDESMLKTINECEDNDVTTVERDIAKFWIEREKVGRHPEVSNLPHEGSVFVKKAHSYSGQDIIAKYQKSKRISKTRSCSSTSSNTSQHSLRSIRRKWSNQQQMATSTEEVPKLNAVSATSAFFDQGNKLRIFNSFSNVWRLSYAERTQHHEGYFDVDKYSLYAASAAQTYRHPLDCVAWESRSVKQRFLYEQSISFTRNWFGCCTELNLNPLIKEPICRPKSMEMPMEADEWTEEWFLNRHRMCHDNREYDDDNSYWDDERPECGTIRNVRLRIGEKISRVTPDLTSHVRRSRWRKKHFPPGTFPYT